MACFTAPLAEAVIVSVVKHSVKKREEKCGEKFESENKIPFSRKIGWLTKMLWGGSFLLAIEHIWHGEITIYPPFLTAMNSAEETFIMLREIATVGVTMAVLVTAIWGAMLAMAHIYEKRVTLCNEEEN